MTLPKQAAATEGRRSEWTLDEAPVGLTWLLRVRWSLSATQVGVLTFAHGAFGAEFDVPFAVALMAFVGATNMAVELWGRRPPEWITGGFLVVDVLVLACLLATSGGAASPFTVFFLVYVALGALLLRPPGAWGLVGLTSTAFAALFLVPGQLTAHRLLCGDVESIVVLHLLGMWIAYVLAAAFIVHFLFKVSQAIRARDRRLADAARDNERLASLSSFSANAAHELGSPLATIALASAELRRALGEGRVGSSLLADADLVTREVERCRSILSGLASRAGESMGEMPIATTPARVMALLHDLLPANRAIRLEVRMSPAARSWTLVAPERTLAEVLHNLVRNAFDAHDEAGIEEPVVVEIEPREGALIHVLDRGPGLSESVRSRLGQPFVTTRASLGGLGLGVYLVMSYASRVGGWLRYGKRPGGGTDAQLFVRSNVLDGSAGG